MRISVDHKPELDKFLKGIRTIYKDRYRSFDPYNLIITSINKKHTIYIYCEPVNKTLFDLNEKRKQMLLIDQYTGDVTDNRPYGRTSEVIGNILDEHCGLGSLEEDHIRLKGFDNNLLLTNDIFNGITEFVRRKTRYGEDISCIRGYGNYHVLSSAGYVKIDFTLTIPGIRFVKILIEMGYDYRYIESRTEVSELLDML